MPKFETTAAIIADASTMARLEIMTLSPMTISWTASMSRSECSLAETVEDNILKITIEKCETISNFSADSHTSYRK